jgi:hypothetical protein
MQQRRKGTTMCQPAVCRVCRKATYRGCGRHVEQVLAGVPQAQRCGCDAKPDQRTGTLWKLFRRR